jgi:peptidoglycan/LPS O-acetylase OafA/YrhL
MIGHLAGTQHFLSAAALAPIGDLGNLGVRVFFVISGFLITHLLLREQASTGAISLRAFYARRFLRIFPAFYVFVAVVAVLASTGVISVDRSDLLHALTYTMNYHATQNFSVTHLWSLSVEEQFYVIWPVTLVMLGVSRASYVLAATLLTVPFLRVETFGRFPGSDEAIRTWFQTVCDALATGCLLAIVLPHLTRSPAWHRVIRSRWLAALPAAILIANMQVDHPHALWLIGIPFMNVAIAVLIARYVQCPNLPAARILNTRAFVAAGIMSYSLYLWQQLFLIQSRPVHSLLQTFPANVTMAIIAAAVSYHFIERPFLRLKTLFQPQSVEATAVFARRQSGIAAAHRQQMAPSQRLP